MVNTRKWSTLHVTRHTSHITHHMSHITCHTSRVIHIAHRLALINVDGDIVIIISSMPITITIIITTAGK